MFILKASFLIYLFPKKVCFHDQQIRTINDKTLYCAKSTFSLLLLQKQTLNYFAISGRFVLYSFVCLVMISLYKQ